MSDERPSDDPERLREVAKEALTANRAALRARPVPIDVEPPTIFGVEQPRRPMPDPASRHSGTA
ncbi:MAG: hypothetical protein ABR525_05300 [Candidatus Limnocylindria bacterium]